MTTYSEPTFASVKAASIKAGYSLSDDDLEYQHNFAKNLIHSLNILDGIKVDGDSVNRDKGEKPSEHENLYNQWAWRCNIQKKSSGKLAGMKIAVKDCVAVAGVPMQAGCAGIVDYIPTYDAPFISTLLDEGAIIVGKTNLECFCMSPLSHTCCNGNVLNPFDIKRTTGGSSSGSAVAVATGEVEMSIGTDTGGSVRIPSNFCGLVGMKPTTGFLSTMGVTPCRPLLDTVGPLTKTIKNNAICLEVMAESNKKLKYIAGLYDYTSHLEDGVKNMKIAILKEGFEGANVDYEVVEVVRTCIDKLKQYKVTFAEINIPECKLARDLLASYSVVAREYLQNKLCNKGQLILKSEIKKHFVDQNKFSYSAIATSLVGYILSDEEGDRCFEKAEDVSHMLAAKFDKYLEEFDAICCPTIPMKAPLLPNNNEIFNQSPAEFNNPRIANITGHPALTVNCGFTSDGLPVGIMFTGKYYDEKTLYRIGRAVEKMSEN